MGFTVSTYLLAPVSEYLIRVAYRYAGTDPIGTEIHFEKDQYFTVSLRTSTKRHHFIFGHRFVSTNETSCFLLAPPCTANPMTHHVLIPAERVPDSVKNPCSLE